MERSPPKIHPPFWPAQHSWSRRWHWTQLVKHALDPVTAVVVYLGVLAANRATPGGPDVALLLFALFLLFPVRAPFRTFDRHVVLAVLGAWLRVALGVGALWLTFELLGLDLDLDPEVMMAWLALTPAAMLLLHAATPRLGPRTWTFYPERRVVLVGVNDVAVRVARSIEHGDSEGLRFAGYFDDRSAARLSEFAPCPVIGGVADVSSYVQRHGIDAIYISLPLASRPRIVSLLASLADTTASIHFLPDILIADPIQARVTTVAGLPVVSVCETPFDGPAGAFKRAFDLVLTIGSLPLLIPLVLVIAAMVRATSRGPAFFKQRRYGLDGKPILVWKFRTMTTAEDGEHVYRQVTRGDARVTPFGAFLRASSLDELPQLFNVLCGSMSLVGPRPHAVAVNEQYRKLIHRYMVRHKVKPGITGWAQVNGCRGGDDLPSMQRRTEYDLAYLRSWSVWLDIVIILRTARMLVAGDERAY